jgi:para-nitrobenzyl esterase
MSEDCLSVNVWTPSVRGRRPVLVFLHGGAWVSGSGGQDWYDGTRLAEQAGVVVVTVNYRLGALGWLYSAELGAGNAGLRDQLAALRWVRENIGGFGGDPGQVTLAGQSAGALSVLALMSSPRAHGLFHRVVLQSAPTGIVPRTPDDAAEVTERYLAQVGVSGVDELAAQPVERLLDAQRALMGASPPLRLAPPFHLVADGDLVADDLLADGWGRGLDRMAGTTRDEARAWVVPDPRLVDLDRAGVVAVAADFLGDGAEDAYERHVSPGRAPVRVLCAMTTEFFFTRDLPAIARGGYVYRFDWAPSAFGSCHCLELPFVFGNLGAWAQAPMLAGSAPAERRVLSRKLMAAWGSFARRGRPGWRAVREGGSVRRLAGHS